jgi:hypothetical protein
MNISMHFYVHTYNHELTVIPLPLLQYHMIHSCLPQFYILKPLLRQ